MIQFSCPKCHKVFKVADELASRKGRCNACGTSFQLPAIADANPPDLPDLAALELAATIPTRGTHRPQTKPCRGCGAPMTAHSVVCMQCGFDHLKNRTLTFATSSGFLERFKPWQLIAGGSAMVVIIAFVVAILVYLSRESPKPTAADASPTSNQIIAAETGPTPPPPADPPLPAVPQNTSEPTLAGARNGFKTVLTRRLHDGEPPAVPPADLFQLVKYPSPIGALSAYISVKPADNKRHPAIIWVQGGFDNGIGASSWEPAPPSNDQSARAFREAGLLMLYPSLRGGNDNPGFRESFMGEVDDVLAAADYLVKQDYVDPARIYLGGHSTGGTLTLLTAECTDRFRAVICFGPVGDITNYGEDAMIFDRSNVQENYLRNPDQWLSCVHSPVFVFEGRLRPSNYISLLSMKMMNHNPAISFFPVEHVSHFSILAPVTRLIAKKLVMDTWPTCNVSFTTGEIARAVEQAGQE